MADLTVTNLRRWFERLQTQHAATAGLIEELRMMLDGEESHGEKIRRLFAAWGPLWRARYGRAYVQVPGKDARLFGDLLKTLTVTEIVDRMTAYLRSNEPFHVKANHSLGVFKSVINDFGGQAAAGEAPALDLEPAPRDCRHTPTCRTAAAHARRVREDARG